MMIGLGTIINAASIAAAGLAGTVFNKFFNTEKQDSLTKACGVSVLFIGISGAMTGMLKPEGTVLTCARSMFIVLCLAIGTVIGELLNIENGFERFVSEPWLSSAPFRTACWEITPLWP